MKTPAEIIYEQFNLLSDRDFKTWMLNNYEELTPSTYVLVRKDSLEELTDPFHRIQNTMLSCALLLKNMITNHLFFYTKG
jgi:hypothetical protein